MTWSDVQKRLVQEIANRRLRVVSREVNIHYTMLHRLATGGTKHPRVDTAQRLIDYYQAREAELNTL